MHSQIIIPKSSPVPIDVPRELIGHKVRVTVDAVDGENIFADKEEVMRSFNAIRIDTSGFIFDREAANERG